MSDAQGGYIALHRKLRSHWLWNDGHTFSKLEAWIDLLFDARWKKRAGSVTIGTKKIRCERGQTIRSCESWAMRWKWSKSRVYRFLMLLKERNAIRTESVTKATRITIVNYDAYQIEQNDNGTMSETQTRHIRRSKEDKEEEKDLPPKKTAASKPRKPNPLWDVVVEVFNLPTDTKTEQGFVGKIAKELKAKKATPDDVRLRAKNYKLHWPDMAFTATAVMKHWNAMAELPVEKFEIDFTLPKAPMTRKTLIDILHWTPEQADAEMERLANLAT